VRSPSFSNPDSGPVRQSAPVPGPPRAVLGRDDSGEAAKVSSASCRLLIVEDDYLIASQMEDALQEAGFEVTGVANSAEEALALAQEHRPGLVVMDIRLQGTRDGIDAALELFATLGIRCVFATAHHDERARTRAAAACPLGWLPKPYTMRSLVAVLRKAVRDLEQVEN
jgi:two-component system, response regulator PdtaR